jgi:hypothetical protein
VHRDTRTIPKDLVILMLPLGFRHHARTLLPLTHGIPRFSTVPYIPRVLSDDERARFAAEGFLLLPSLLTAAEKANACAWAREVQAWPETAGKWMQYFEVPAGGSRQLCRTENYLGFHDGLRAMIQV